MPTPLHPDYKSITENPFYGNIKLSQQKKLLDLPESEQKWKTPCTSQTNQNTTRRASSLYIFFIKKLSPISTETRKCPFKSPWLGNLYGRFSKISRFISLAARSKNRNKLVAGIYLTGQGLHLAFGELNIIGMHRLAVKVAIKLRKEMPL